MAGHSRQVWWWLWAGTGGWDNYNRGSIPKTMAEWSRKKNGRTHMAYTTGPITE